MNGQEHCKAVAMENEIQVLQHLLNESRFTLVITGAGISVSAGIPSMHGLNLAETMQFISVRLLKSAPEHYYKVARHSFLDAIFGNGPTIAHTKLAELETEGKIQGIITTNLDGLHSLAGSKNVAEIQGSFGVNICLNCGKRKDDIRIWNQGKAPRCECGGLYCCYPVYSHVGLLQEAVKKAQSWASQFFRNCQYFFVLEKLSFDTAYDKMTVDGGPFQVPPVRRLYIILRRYGIPVSSGVLFFLAAFRYKNF